MILDELDSVYGESRQLWIISSFDFPLASPRSIWSSYFGFHSPPMTSMESFIHSHNNKKKHQSCLNATPYLNTLNQAQGWARTEWNGPKNWSVASRAIFVNHAEVFLGIHLQWTLHSALAEQDRCCQSPDGETTLKITPCPLFFLKGGRENGIFGKFRLFKVLAFQKIGRGNIPFRVLERSKKHA